MIRSLWSLWPWSQLTLVTSTWSFTMTRSPLSRPPASTPARTRCRQPLKMPATLSVMTPALGRCTGTPGGRRWSVAWTLASASLKCPTLQRRKEPQTETERDMPCKGGCQRSLRLPQGVLRKTLCVCRFMFSGFKACLCLLHIIFLLRLVFSSVLLTLVLAMFMFFNEASEKSIHEVAFRVWTK